jgi:hypothetical protein
VESLVRHREPAAFLTLGALVVNLVLLVLAVLLDRGPLVAVAAQLSYPAALPGLVVVLAVLVASCVLGRTPRARVLTGLSVVVTGLAAVVAVALALADLAAGGPSPLIEILPAVAAFSVSVIVLGLMIMMLRRPAEPVPSAQPIGEDADTGPEPPEVVDPQRQPTWSTDVAAGAAWRTAGDAASGAPATGWDAPDGPAGWGIASPPTGSEPTAPEPRRPDSTG